MATIDGKKAATAAEKAKYEKEQVQRVALPLHCHGVHRVVT
jgi:hypothetical protein